MSLPRAKLVKNFPGCPVEATLSLLDGKWKGVILFHLMEGTLRFNEIRRKLPSVTQRMLTKQLRELEVSGLVSRTVFPVVPPRVDYALTPLGASLEPIIKAMAVWGEENVLCHAGRQELRLSPASCAPAAALQGNR
ncbi:helix-turn-helix domain-containing protein [Rhizobium sp. BK602]|uniref:winged helix-turn-helix transcriptional regulator n=1 Tax=Rhizobium sp. BK602 TaxID=2586986 RepID=UPI0016191A67|nr:helix-turn-helix domain-containing protein [Rhizobium sp. BK602]MBB3608849.1 DNA-binding HxlR family transcriptional regulator [Rhizobium sp. BK602]